MMIEIELWYVWVRANKVPHWFACMLLMRTYSGNSSTKRALRCNADIRR